MNHITALIADDEPLLRERLHAHLAQLWPELVIVADARNGNEALELFELHQPQIVFLDVRMPGMNGIETARALERKAHLVFITAYESYAIQAFDQGAIDYLVKPIDPARLADTVQRLQQRLARPPQANLGLELLESQLRQRSPARGWLQWIKASVGSSVRLIPVEQVLYMRSDEKYTLVTWRDGEAVIRKSIKELSEALDPERFVQVHRSVIVNLHCVSEVVRGVNETAEIHLHGRTEVLPVSRSYLHHFRQM
ncbi:MAG: LytTR family DNA-binding domain-containing protein [Pseudomonadota bacterium]